MEKYHHCQPTDRITADSEPDTDSNYELDIRPGSFDFDSSVEIKRVPVQHDSSHSNQRPKIHLPPGHYGQHAGRNIAYHNNGSTLDHMDSLEIKNYSSFDSRMSYQIREKPLCGTDQSRSAFERSISLPQDKQPAPPCNPKSMSLNRITQPNNCTSNQIRYPNIGLQHSLSNIKTPPTFTENSSPYGSNQSLGSQDTNLSFHTVNASLQEDYQQQANAVSSSRISNQSGSTQPYTRPQHRNSDNSTSVFITYAPEDEAHLRNVVQLSQTLYHNSITVQVDLLEKGAQSVSISEWLDNNFIHNDFILVCISPSYNDLVKSNEKTDMAIGGLQYIYRQLHREYITNGSKNYRFIPVLISGGRLTDIPMWLRDTTVFQWPNDYEDIIYRLLKKEKYIKPEIGPRPEITVVRYGNISASNK